MEIDAGTAVELFYQTRIAIRDKPRGLDLLTTSPSGDLNRDRETLCQIVGYLQDAGQRMMNHPASKDEYIIGVALAGAKPRPEWLPIFRSAFENPPDWWNRPDDGFWDEASAVLLAEWLYQHPDVLTPFFLELIADRQLRPHATSILYHYLTSGLYELPPGLSGAVEKLAEEVDDMSEFEAQELVSMVGEQRTEKSRRSLRRIAHKLPARYAAVHEDLQTYL